jgi:hypothetical protein
MKHATLRPHDIEQLTAAPFVPRQPTAADFGNPEDWRRWRYASDPAYRQKRLDSANRAKDRKRAKANGETPEPYATRGRPSKHADGGSTPPATTGDHA